jgi:hypothetical protein
MEPQNIKDFLNNPMGKGSAILNAKLIKENLDKRYNRLLKKYKKFDYTIYRSKNDYYFHFIIPSETERDNTYDVIIQFTEMKENFKYDNFLNRYYLKFFSNCPSFTYTYAYAIYSNNLLIDFLKDKYGSSVIKNKPVVRNPNETLGFEKSTYYACKYIVEHMGLTNKSYINGISIPFNENVLIKKIRNIKQIDSEIKKENVKVKELHSETKSKGSVKHGTTIPHVQNKTLPNSGVHYVEKTKNTILTKKSNKKIGNTIKKK